MTIEVGLDDRGRWPSSVGRADQGRPLREKRVSPRRPLRESVPVLVGRKCVGLPCLHFLRLWTNCAARRRGWIRPGAWRLTHSGNPRNIPPRASQRRLFCAVQARGKRKGKESCLQLTSWSARAARRRSTSRRPRRSRATRRSAACAPACTPRPPRSRTPLFERSAVCVSSTVWRSRPTSPARATTSRSTPWCSSAAAV